MIYDDVLNITWLQDAHYSFTSGFDDDGYLTWDEAVAWAGQLVFGGYDDWRLPSTTYPDSTCSSTSVDTTDVYNCTGSEMGYMFYLNLGGQPGKNIVETHNANFDLFINHQSNRYWSDTEYLGDTTKGWSFDFVYGGQLVDTKDGHFYAWAVRDGDVARIPEPSSILLMLAGGLGMVGLMYIRKSFR